MPPSNSLVKSSLFLSAALLSLSLIGCGSQNLQFQLTFEDAKGLKPGQLVVHQGKRIGSVTKVEALAAKEFRVGVEISHDPTSKLVLYREDSYSIEAPGGALDFSGKRQISVTNSNSSQRIPVENGDVIAGFEGILSNLKKAALTSLDQIKKSTTAVLENVKEFSESPEGKQLREDMTRYAEAMKNQSQAEAKEFEAKIRASAEQWKAKLEAKGNEQQAKVFIDGFLKWIEDVKAGR